MNHYAKKEAEPSFLKLLGSWILMVFLLFLLIVFFWAPMHAQERSNTYYAAQFPGLDAGTKIANAQNACNPDFTCTIVIDAILSRWPAGTDPAKCSQCVWMDYRNAGLTISPFAVGDLSNLNNIQFASSTVTIPQACANLTTGGGTVMVTEDLTVNSNQTLTVGTRKPCILDLNGHSINFQFGTPPGNMTGVGLTVNAQGTSSNDVLIIKNGWVTCSGTRTGDTAIKFLNMTSPSLFNVGFFDCSASGEQPLVFDNAQNARCVLCTFSGDTFPLTLQDTANDFTCAYCVFDFNDGPWRVIDTSGVTFFQTLSQSTTGTHCGEVTSSAVNIISFNYIGGWFENCGDGTTNSRDILFSSGTSRFIQGIQLNGIAMSSTNGTASELIEFAGPGAISSPVFESIRNTSALPLAGGSAYLAYIHSIVLGGDGPSNYDVGVGVSGSQGITMFPVGATNCFALTGGTVGNFQGDMILQSGSSCASLTTTDVFRPNIPGSAGIVINSGTASMTTASIAAGGCGTTVTVAATNVASSDVVKFDRNASVSTPNGLLALNAWASVGNVNFNYCNPTASSQTPSAATINWVVVR